MPQLDPTRYRQALARRGLTGRDLRRIGRLSKPTLAALANGREVSAGTLRRLESVLAAVPIMQEVAPLLVEDPHAPRGNPTAPGSP